MLKWSAASSTIDIQSLGPMRQSLTPRSNVLLLSMWTLVLFGAGLVAWLGARWLACTTFFLGAVAGGLQTNALRESSAAFREASTAIQVRQAMTATSAGKLSIALLWVASAIAIIWALAGGLGNPLAVVFAGYASFALAREIFSFAAVKHLAQAAEVMCPRLVFSKRPSAAARFTS